MPISNYPNGFVNGVTIRGVPVLQSQPGQVFWVNNSSVLSPDGVGGTDSGPGTYKQPFSTIDYAVGRCVASRGDIILVMPGHAETITTAAQLILDVAGIAIIGLGAGSLRPTLTFGAAAANIPITAANVSVKNILHVANFADVASYYTVTGTATPKDFAIEECEFRDTSSILNALKIVTDNATVNALDGFNFVKNHVWSLGTTAATTAISLLAAANRMRLQDNQMTYAVLNDTPALMTMSTFIALDLIISGNRVFRANTSSTGGTLFSGSGVCTGLVYDNYVWHLDNSAGLMATTGQALGFFENYCPITSAADKSGLINPVAV